MNRRVREKREKRTAARDRFGTGPTPAETRPALAAAFSATADIAACQLSPGTWRPAIVPSSITEPVAQTAAAPPEEADEPIACEEAPVSAAEPEPVSTDEESVFPFVLGLSGHESLEPLLFEHGPDVPSKPEEDPFADLIALAEIVSDAAADAVRSVEEQDPDLRAIVLASHDTTVVEAMALGDVDSALSAFEQNGKRLRDSAERLRKRLAAPRPQNAELTEAQQKDATVAHLRRVVRSLVEEADGLCALVTNLETLAVETGNAYRSACAESDRVLDEIAASWPRLNVAVCMHMAAKPDASAEAIAGFREVARRVIADEERITSALDARTRAEERISDVHRAWHEGRSRALEVRKNLQGTTAACQILGIQESTFASFVDAGLHACRTSISEMDAHKSLVVIQPVTIPDAVEKTRAMLAQIRELGERLGQRTGDELGRLVLLGYHLIVRDRRGKSVKGVCRVLVHAGLLAENDMDRAIASVEPELRRLFVKAANDRFDLYALNDLGRRLAAEIAGEYADLPDLERRIAQAKEAAREEQIAVRERWKASVHERAARRA